MGEEKEVHSPPRGVTRRIRVVCDSRSVIRASSNVPLSPHREKSFLPISRGEGIRFLFNEKMKMK
jgi:hypothetical protein